MILVDTSVWVDHLRKGDDELKAVLLAGEAACHPFVLGELACGHIHRRQEILSLMAALPMLPKAEDPEVLAFIDRHRLMGSGLGLVDVHLLASCLLAKVQIWTRDKPLARAAARLGLAASR